MKQTGFEYRSFDMQGPDGAVDSRKGLRLTTRKEEVEEMEMRLDLLFKTLLCQLLQHPHRHMRIPEQRKNKGILRQRFPAVVSGC